MSKIWKFAPWAAVFAWQAIGRAADFPVWGMRWVSLVVLAVIAWAWVVLRRKGDASQLELSMLFFSGLAVVGFWLWPSGLGRLLSGYGLPCFYGVVFVVLVGIPLAGGELFTMHFAKRTTPEAVWRTDIFKTINRNMTAVWAALFGLAGLFGLLAQWLWIPGGPIWRGVLLETLPPLILFLGVGLPYTIFYPGYYQRRMGLTPARVSPTASSSGVQDAAPVFNNESTLKEGKAMFNKPTVVAVAGSPHQAVGNTTMMVEMMRPTLAAEGFDLEVVQLSANHIEYCTGCGHCMEKGRCWIPDDHAKIADKLLAADGIILASPVYFFHVTAQMKTFIDRSLALGHKPRTSWKPGLSVSVSAGLGESDVAEYLGQMLRPFGAFCVGSLTAMAVQPGGFVGPELVRARAAELAGNLARAIKEKRRYPATDRDLRFWRFMGWLVEQNKDTVMQDDYAHWCEHGLMDSFESFMGQERPAMTEQNHEVRRAWIRQMMADYKAERKGRVESGDAVKPEAAAHPGPATVKTLRELLEIMPRGLNKKAAAGLKAVYQFEVSGDEQFTAHLVIDDGRCEFREGPAESPGVTVKTPADVWLAVSRGEMNGQAAFMSGKYRVEGDIGLLMKLGSLFQS